INGVPVADQAVPAIRLAGVLAVLFLALPAPATRRDLIVSLVLVVPFLVIERLVEFIPRMISVEAGWWSHDYDTAIFLAPAGVAAGELLGRRIPWRAGFLLGGTGSLVVVLLL